MGAWIETEQRHLPRHRTVVAPHMGAWIETSEAGRTNASEGRSHPIWVRGLKRLTTTPSRTPMHRRTPYGCVD